MLINMEMWYNKLMYSQNKQRQEALHALRSFNELFPQDEAEDYSLAVKNLENLYEGLKFEHVGGVIPVQADAVFKGQRLYFRFRGDTASLMTGTDEGIDKLPSNAKTFQIDNITGEKFNGLLNCYEFEKTFNSLMQMLLNGDVN